MRQHKQLAIDNLRTMWRTMDNMGRSDLYSDAPSHRKPTSLRDFTHAAAEAGYRVHITLEREEQA